MRVLPIALFLAIATWIVGCATPDVVGTRNRGGDTAAGDDDDDQATPAKKKTKSTPTTPVGAETTPGTNNAPTTGDPVVTTPTTPDTTPTTPDPVTTPTQTTPTPTTPDPTPAPAVTHTTFTTLANLNLRTGPSTANSIVLTMPKGSACEAIDETPTDNWYHVSFDGQEGWASGSYLQEE